MGLKQLRAHEVGRPLSSSAPRIRTLLSSAVCVRQNEQRALWRFSSSSDALDRASTLTRPFFITFILTLSLIAGHALDLFLPGRHLPQARAAVGAAGFGREQDGHKQLPRLVKLLGFGRGQGGQGGRGGEECRRGGRVRRWAVMCHVGRAWRGQGGTTLFGASYAEAVCTAGAVCPRSQRQGEEEAFEGLCDELPDQGAQQVVPLPHPFMSRPPLVSRVLSRGPERRRVWWAAPATDLPPSVLHQEHDDSVRRHIRIRQVDPR